MAAAYESRGSVVDRSPLAGVVAVILLFVGLLLASYTVLVPALLGLLLLMASGRFLSSRLNPLSMSFYVPTKPSWTAILLVGVVGLVLLSAAYLDWRSGFGPILPGHLP